DERGRHSRLSRTVISVDHLGFGFELESEVPDSRFLVLGSVFAMDIGQREVVVRVSVAEKARLVVRLAIDLFKANDRSVEIGRSFVVADEQVRMAEPARTKELFRRLK